MISLPARFSARLISLAALAAFALLPLSVHAHATGDVHHWWTLDPWVLTPLSLTGLLYLSGVLLLRHRQHAGIAVRWPTLVSAALGTAVIFFALVWPLDAFSESSFAAHMAQHMLLIAGAGPLLAAARPGIAITAALATFSPALAKTLAQPRKWLRIMLLPSVVFAVHGAVIWGWHAPLLFESALRWEWVHRIEHVSFLIAGYWYWAVLLRQADAEGGGHAAAALWSLATLMHTGLLGALITFAPRPLYATYVETQGGVAAALQDQQLAGLLMWVPMAIPYVIGGLAFAAAWMQESERFSVTDKQTWESDARPVTPPE